MALERLDGTFAGGREHLDWQGTDRRAVQEAHPGLRGADQQGPHGHDRAERLHAATGRGSDHGRRPDRRGRRRQRRRVGAAGRRARPRWRCRCIGNAETGSVPAPVTALQEPVSYVAGPSAGGVREGDAADRDRRITRSTPAGATMTGRQSPHPRHGHPLRARGHGDAGHRRRVVKPQADRAG